MSVEGISVASFQALPGLYKTYNSQHQNNTASYERPNKLADLSRNNWQQAVHDDKPDTNTSSLLGNIRKVRNTNFESVQSNTKDTQVKPSQNRLNKTTSVGGINAVSNSKVVLRRWTSLIHEEDKTTKRHSASACEGNRKEKNVFRPVSSILLSTPWEKDFIGNSKTNFRKTKSVENNLQQDFESRNDEGSFEAQPNKPIQNCLLKEKIQEPNELNNNKACEHVGLIVGKSNSQFSDKSGVNNAGIEKRSLLKDNVLSQERERKENNHNQNNDPVKDETAILTTNNRPFNKSDPCLQTANEPLAETFENIDNNKIVDMPLSSGSSYYRSKYDTNSDITSKRANVSSSFLRRPNLPISTRVTPRNLVGAGETSYSSSYATTKVKELDQSVKDTVQEVDAYIQAYKSRRERSFEYGENSIYSNTSSRSNRKSSFDQNREITHIGHANRSYTPSYSSQEPWQKSSFGRTSDKDYSYSSYTRPSNYSSVKSDRSKSFDIEPNYYQKSLTRTGSGGRYVRSALTSNSSSGSSSKSSSRKFSPSEPVFSGRSYIPGTHEVTSRPISSAVSTSPSTRNRISLTDSGRDKIKSQSSIETLLSPGESSRSRIMGGILSRFFHDGESTSVVPTSPPSTSEDSSQTASHVSESGQLVKVKSSFVSSDTNASSPEKEEKSIIPELRYKESNMGVASTKDNKESKAEQTPAEPKERRSSWIGRSLRKISSSSKPTVEEISEKPKRERRRSLLWRLGRDSKTSESDAVDVEKSASATDITDAGESKAKKVEEKGKSSEEKGISGLLRRSSKRRKSQSPEKEIVEKSQEASIEARVKDTVDNKALHNLTAQQSQSQLPNHSNVKTESPVPEEPFIIIDKPTGFISAPLAEVEHSDDEQDFQMSRITKKDSPQTANANQEGSRFADVLRKKELERKGKAAAKNEAKTGSSYLSSRFMKSKNMFENTADTKSNSGQNRGGAVAIKESRLSSIDQKRAAFQMQAPRSKSIDVVSPTKLSSFDSKISRTALRDRNKQPATKPLTEEVAGQNETTTKTSSRGAITEKSKAAVRRVTSDSVLKFNSSGARNVIEKTTATEQVISSRDKELKQKSDYEQSKELEGLKGDMSMKSKKTRISEGVREKPADKQSNIEKPQESLQNTETQLELKLQNNSDIENKPTKVSSPIRRGNREIFGISAEIDERKDEEKENKIMRETATKTKEEISTTSVDVAHVDNKTSDTHLTTTSANEMDEKPVDSERAGSRRRRERRSNRAKAVVPSDIAQVKEQMRSDSIAKDADAVGDTRDVVVDQKKIAAEETSIESFETKEKTCIAEESVSSVKDAKQDFSTEMPLVVDAKISTKTEATKALDSPCVTDDMEDGKLRKDGNVDKDATAVNIDIKKKLLNGDVEDDSNESSSSSSGPKLTTKSVIKEKIRQKKNTKHRAARAMSLPLGVNVIITPPTEDSKGYTVKEKLLNGNVLPLVMSKPPINPPKQRSQEADDISTFKKKAKRPIRSRPKTLTQGIDPGLLLSDIKAKEEAVVVEEKLSIVEIKQRLLRSETSGSGTPKTPEVQRKNKRRSGKRYKTITEGIAPGILEQAHQFASNGTDAHLLGVDHMNKLNLALSASTENLKRRSFIVSEVNSRVGSKGTSLATSVEDLSLKDDGNEKSESGFDSVVELSIKKLKKLPMALDSDDDEEKMPSVSSLKQRFMQAVEDSYKAPNKKVVMRQARGNKDRPFTISGIDDITLRKIQIDMNERRDSLTKVPYLKADTAENEERQNGDGDVRKDATKKMEVLSENEIEEIMEAEGLTADQLASKLGINPSLSRGSPLRARKPFLGSTTEESVVDVLEIIEEKPEKQQKQTGPLGNLRQQFLSAMTEFKGGANDEDIKDKQEIEVEDEKPKHRRVGVVSSTDEGGQDILGEDSTLSDWDTISQNTSQLQSMTDRRHLKPQRRQRTSANPLKSLQARDDLIAEVGSNKKNEEDKKPEPTESKGLHALSQKSLGQKLWRKVALANEAKAALQGTEDFSKVKLKKVKEPGKLSSDGDENGGVKQSSVTNLLLKIKGRRRVQINIADFSTSSLNSGDSFVVVTPKDLFCWHGRHANVIEKAKAAEIASRINQKKEMGCKAFDVVYYEQDGQNESRVFRTLGSDSTVNIKDDDVDDEDYEKNMMTTYMAYRLQDSDPPELVPVYDMCQRSPSKDILVTNEAFVFDFLSEVYVWIGRQTTSSLRKKIMKLAREKYDQGYFKPPTPTNTPHHHGKNRKISLTATELPMRKQSLNRKMSVHKFLVDKDNLTPRPPHSIFMSMFEEAEWVIFKEKFCDWPDESRIIRMKGGPQVRGEMHKKVDVADVKTVDASTMVQPKSEPRSLVFEGTDIDRGQGKPKGSDGYHIITRNIQIWHITEGNRTLLAESSFGNFHSGEGYVIRWEYSIVASRVMKMLKDMEEAKSSGRQRCAYFFWLGNDCSITEQGATAVMTVDLDEERGPHVRVLQGKEPPCFLNLFEGGMIVHAGKRQSQGNKATFSDRSVVRFYCVRNEIPSEASLLQVPVAAHSLRSRSSFVLVLCNQAEIFLWHGCKSSEATRESAINAAHRLIENHPEEAALSAKNEIFLTEIEEGHEPEVFWVALGGEEDYGSLLLDINNSWEFVPRCFHMTSETGVFVANEITNPSMTPKEKCPFPFLQDDLYDAYQPAIFIIDAIHELYLWLGWWPEDEENENSDAQRLRWDMLKKKAMESVVLYAKEAGRSLSHAYVVDAGLEPDQFTHLFPYWIVQEDITDIQLEDGREDDDKLHLITEKLEGFSREFYTIDELRQRPLPEGVNPAILETYLSDEDFETIFTISRSEFKQMPNWKQVNLKKRSGLY